VNRTVRAIGVCLWAFVLAGFLVGCGQRTKDPVIMRINGEEVRKSELDLLGRNVLVKAGIQPGSEEGRQYLKAQLDNMYDSLISLYLIQQSAQATQAEPSEEEIDKAIEAFKNEFPDAAEYEKFVEMTGLPVSEFRLSFKNKLLSERFQLGKLEEARKNLTEEAVRQWYDQHQEQFRAPNMLRIRTILFQIPHGASPEQRVAVKEKAEHIRQNLTGADEETFATTAREISEDTPTAPNGGDLGFIPLRSARESFPAGVADSIFGLKKGDISPVLQTTMGYWIFMITDDEQDFEEAKKQIEDQMVIEAFAKWMNEAREKATIEILIGPQEVYAEPTPAAQ